MDNRVWKHLIHRIDQIEQSLNQNGQYIDKSDAVNLASVDINSPLIQLDDNSNSYSPTLRGFSKLILDLQTILNELYIHQQREIIQLRNSIHTTFDFIEKNYEYLRLDHNYESEVVHMETNLLGVDDIVTSITNDWNQLPPADDEEEHNQLLHHHNSPHLRYLDRKRKINLLRTKLHRRIEDNHHLLQMIIDAKVHCYMMINSTFDNYIHLLVIEAHACGVSNALHRANIATRSHRPSLLQNRFLETTEVDGLLEKVKQSWTKLSSNHDSVYMNRSLSINYSYSERLTDNWLDSVKIGAGVTLLCWAVSECFNNERLGHHIWNDATFAIFMCLGDLLLLLWMWGVSIHVWRMHDIDFIRLLNLHGSELDHSNYPERMVYAAASDMTLIFLVVFIIFNKAIRGVFDMNGSLIFAHSLPIMMSFYFFYRMIYPWHRRKRWFYMLYQVITAPMHAVSFRDGYIGDILTSLVRVTNSMLFAVIYIIFVIINLVTFHISFEASSSISWWTDSIIYMKLIIPFLSIMPLWIRLMQCLRRSVESGHRWPHMANALKYASAMSVISYGIFHAELHRSSLWISCFVMATIFQFSWDLTMDWGLIVWSTSKYASASSYSFLGLSIRENRLYGSLWLYISFMICNLFLRFAWILTLLPPTIAGVEGSLGYALLYHLGPIIAAGEVLRRMIWGFYRLEYEQIESLPTAGDTIAHHDAMDLLSSSNSESPQKRAWLEFDWTSSASGLLTYLQPLRSLGLSSTSTLKQRGRFIESILFAMVMLAIVFSAAITA